MGPLSCEQDWWPVISVIFVSRIFACWRWVWWDVLSQFAETKNYCSACNAKSEGGRAKNNVTLLTAMGAVCGDRIRSWSGGRGPRHFLENYTGSVANFWPNFGGFLLGWGGLPIHPLHQHHHLYQPLG